MPARTPDKLSFLWHLGNAAIGAAIVLVGLFGALLTEGPALMLSIPFLCFSIVLLSKRAAWQLVTQKDFFFGATFHIGNIIIAVALGFALMLIPALGIPILNPLPNESVLGLSWIVASLIAIHAFASVRAERFIRKAHRTANQSAAQQGEGNIKIEASDSRGATPNRVQGQDLGRVLEARRPNSDEVEKEVEELYSQILSQEGTGMTQKGARVMVREAMALCKAQAIKEGTANLPSNYGDLLLKAAESGDQDSRIIVDKAHIEGSTDDDIQEYWNLPDLMRRMVYWSENVFRVSFAMGQWDHDLSKDEQQEAAIQIRKAFPMYGDPADVRVTSGEDRPLPQELRGRVDRWRMRIINEWGKEGLKAKLEKYSTFNALVREEIRRGNL
jgi:hypothetical protein